MKCLESLIVAFSMYSKIPMPQITWTKENMKNTLCYFPLIGAVIGALLWLWYWLCGIAGFGVMLQAVVAVLIPVLVTGGIGWFFGYIRCIKLLADDRTAA